MGKFAEETKVTVEQTRAEIERTLNRYGADSFMFGTKRGGDVSIISFEAQNRKIKFTLCIPPQTDSQFTHTPERKIQRSPAQVLDAWEQGRRQRWRALLLAIKAKLEAVESGIATFEQEFLAYTVLPGGETVGDQIAPQIEAVYNGRGSALLLGSGGL